MSQNSFIGVRFAPRKVRLLKTIIYLKLCREGARRERGESQEEKEGGDYINEFDRR